MGGEHLSLMIPWITTVEDKTPGGWLFDAVFITCTLHFVGIYISWLSCEVIKAGLFMLRGRIMWNFDDR